MTSTRHSGANAAQLYISRRALIGGTVGAAAAGLLAARSLADQSFALSDAQAGATTIDTANVTDVTASAGGTLPIPDILEPTDDNGVSVFPLEMKTGTTEIISGTASSTAGYNGTFMGPTLKIANGEQVRFEVTNNLGEESTTHWHGLHVGAANDGGPQNTIADGGTWSPETTVIQQACTLWYHPHGLGTTARQVSLGLTGMIIVDDGSAANAALPTDYGANDIPLILNSTAVTSTGTLAATNGNFTASGSTLQFLVNGTSATTETPTLIAAENRIRLRLLNASLTDSMTISRTDGATITQVASDAGLLTAPLSVSSLTIATGERAEIIIDMLNTETVTLQAAPANAAGTTRYTVQMLQITTTGTETPAALPATLNTITALDTTDAAARTFTLAATAGQQTINGIAGNTLAAMTENMVMVSLGDTEVWTVVNGTTNTYHSFHMHDVPFQVLSINGEPPTGADLGWKDTVLLPPGQTMDIAMQFINFADSEYMYMIHCHNLVHEDSGMMLGLMVT